MPWVGAIVPDATVDMPTSLVSLGRNANGSVNLTHPAPTGTVAGDRMMLSLSGYSLTGPFGADGVVVPDASWTELASHSSIAIHRQTARLYSKIADAADEAGTSSYSWQMTGGFAYGAIMCSTIPQAHGTSVSTANINADTTTSFSTSTPSGAWVFVATVGKWFRSGSGEPRVDLSTSGAVLLASYLTAVEERGRHRHYAVPTSAASIAGAMAGASVTYPYGGVIAVGIS